MPVYVRATVRVPTEHFSVEVGDLSSGSTETNHDRIQGAASEFASRPPVLAPSIGRVRPEFERED